MKTEAVKASVRKMITGMDENSKIPTEFELCDTFGVSRGTIRDAISRLVSEGFLEKRHGVGTFVRHRSDTRTKVLLVLRKSSLMLATGSLEHRMTEHNFEKSLTSISEECRKRKAVHSLILPTSILHLKEHLDSLAESSCLVGVILSDELDYPQRLMFESFLDELGLRYCSIDPVDISPRQHSLGIRQEVGITKGLTLLWELGHRRIAFLGVPRYAAGPKAGELTGCCQTFLNFFQDKVGRLDEVMVQDDRSNYSTSYEKIEGLLRLSAPPTAIFCQNDARGSVALEACAKHGVKVPETLSLLGFDNNPETAMRKPHLSSVDLCIEERTRLGVRYLFREIEEVELPTLLDSKFMRNESIGRAKA